MYINNFNGSIPSPLESGVGIELNEKIGQKVISKRNNFYNLFLSRYLETLPFLIQYNTDNEEESKMLKSLDIRKLELGLRHGYNMIIGENVLGHITILGYTNAINHHQKITNFFNDIRLNEKDIYWIVPKEFRPKKMLQITHHNNSKDGNFIVVQNKLYNLTNDIAIIEHYAEMLAEIVTSRYSLIIQSKVLNFFKSEVNDETMNQVINKLYNGYPFVKVSKLFDVEESIVKLDNSSLANNLVQLKLEYQNQLNELNSLIGVDVLGVDKASGVTDFEAKSGNSFSKNISNIYIESRQNAMNLLNKRYNLNIQVEYDNNVNTELTSLMIENNGGGVNENNNNIA